MSTPSGAPRRLSRPSHPVPCECPAAWGAMSPSATPITNYEHELAEQDRIGKVKKNDYMDYYLGVKFHQDKKDEVQPSGMTAKNKNYDYANAKFVESLE